MSKELDIPVLSDMMLRRDNFFHGCWMELKQERPDLWQIMNEVELRQAGLSLPKEKNDDGTDEAEALDIL